MTLRATAGRTRRQLRYANAVTSSRRTKLPVVAYLGWTGEGNIGDESMFLAHQMYLSDVLTLVPFPSLSANRALTAVGSRLRGICLGGGTLIGNGHFGEALDAVLAAAPNVPCFMLGPGCEDSDYSIGKRTNVAVELAKWSERLSRFPDVLVRGPLSVSSLASTGVEATVSGDPALLMPFLRLVPAPELIGLNVGVTDDQWGSAGGDNSSFTDDLIAALLAAGYGVRLVPTTSADFEIARQVAERWNGRVQAPTNALTVQQFLPWVAECAAVVGVKLHAQVLAVTQRVPVIALEYRPKCRDFMLSVGRGDRCMRTDQIDIQRILEWLREDLADSAAVRADLDTQVATRVSALVSAVSLVRERFAAKVA